MKTLLLILALFALAAMVQGEKVQKPHPTAAIVLSVCHKYVDMVIIMSDGSYRALSQMTLADLAELSLPITKIKPGAWVYEHGRLCGVTPL